LIKTITYPSNGKGGSDVDVDVFDGKLVSVIRGWMVGVASAGTEVGRRVGVGGVDGVPQAVNNMMKIIQKDWCKAVFVFNVNLL
jgi:hypothetical protein